LTEVKFIHHSYCFVCLQKSKDHQPLVQKLSGSEPTNPAGRNTPAGKVWGVCVCFIRRWVIDIIHSFCDTYDTCHVRSLHVCFPMSPQGFPLQAFLPMTFTATFVAPAQWQLSFSSILIVFYLLTHLLTYILKIFWKYKIKKISKKCTIDQEL